jgi:hypothetical protein
MKTILIKIAIAFLTIIVMITIAVNSYMFIVAYKLSTSEGVFEKVKIIEDYKVFHNIGLCTWAIATSIILLALMLNIVVRTFLIKKKKTYFLSAEEINIP